MKRDMSGMLNYEYFKEMYAIIQRGVKQEFAEEKRTLVEKRRQLLKEGNTEEYKAIITQMTKREEELTNKILQEVLGSLKISEMEFT